MNLTEARQIISEADAKRDAAMRRASNEAFEVLSKWLRKNGERLPKLANTPRAMAAPQYGGWAIPWKVIDPDFSDRRERWWELAGHIQPLHIVIAGPGHIAGIGKPSSQRSGRVTQWIMILPVLKADNDPKGLTQRLPSYRRTFVHEFIHYLDHGANRARFSSSMSSRKAERGDMVGYFTTPSEFNAYYQEGANDLDRHIGSLLKTFNTYAPGTHDRYRNILIGRVRDILPASPHAFVKNAISGEHYRDSWSADFIDAMKSPGADPKWLRKFKSRLTGLHRHLIKKYGQEMSS